MDQSAKNDRRPTSQMVIVIKERTKPEPPERVYTEDTTVALCAKKESKAVIPQGAISFRVETVESETTDTLAPDIRFEISPTEVAFFANPT